MKLPHFVKDDETAYLVIVLLTVANSLLIATIFFLLVVPSAKKLFPKFTPISAKTPVVRFSLISPQAGATVSGTTPLVTTLSNGPKITRAQLYVDDALVQTITTQKTEKLTIFWDSTKHADGKHTVTIRTGQDNNRTSILATSLIVKNNVAREVGQR